MKFKSGICSAPNGDNPLKVQQEGHKHRADLPFPAAFQGGQQLFLPPPLPIQKLEITRNTSLDNTFLTAGTQGAA